MAPSRPEGQLNLNLNLSSLAPIVEPLAGNTSSKSPFGAPKPTTGGLVGLAGTRVGAGSPSHEQTSRLFPKRTRELATPTGVSSNIWGPPTSGTSTPLFEIPESPNQDGFPDLIPLTETGINSPARRGRAGTLPSRISPVGVSNGVHPLISKTSRPTPSTSPFRPSSTSAAETAFNAAQTTASNSSSLLSRLRAGSMPQRANALNSTNAFNQSPFASAWGSRSRAATLTSIQSAEEGSSPQQPNQTRNGSADPGVRTLDYLGLAESSQALENEFLKADGHTLQSPSSISNMLANLNSRTANRFRSFSVNTQPKYSAGGQEPSSMAYSSNHNGAMTPSTEAQLQAEYQEVSERVRLHNQAVQAFALDASAARPRARTAGIVETPQRASLRRYGHTGGTDTDGSDPSAALFNMAVNPEALTDSFYDLSIMDGSKAYERQEDMSMQLSRSLWIGSIPNSTTISSLEAIFSLYGNVESTRVLTHKNCGFVNYENIQDAVYARQELNGKEIFPGAGPVRIGFAKAPNNSLSAASAQNTASQAPALDSFGTTKSAGTSAGAAHANGADTPAGRPLVNATSIPLNAPMALSETKPDILQIVEEFGSQQADFAATCRVIDEAIEYQDCHVDIPPMSEPSSNRAFDAPRLRDIRKRIDNGTCSIQEIEQIAVDMLPEVAELSSDYLGNTVVQKLFEFCSEPIKDQLLVHIAPHLAEIGVHKNGTWAAQKIIEVCNTEAQMSMIVDHLRPYTVPLFLDQYGNYVLQCCLKFGSPYNDFIFETMLSRLWDVAQGRFGARAMRACLESHHATKYQQRLLAAAIALYSVQLAVSSNGALLLTWLLDTCTFPRRRSVLAPRIVPHLVPLCTHKVAYLTVLKVINQRNEQEAKELVVKSLFFSPNDTILEQILNDQTSGVTLVFKVLTNSFLDDNVRAEVVQSVAKILERIKAQPNQGYKRLIDEVGLNARPTAPVMQQYPNNAHSTPKQMANVNNTQYANLMGTMSAQGYNTAGGLGRTHANESFGYSPYGMNGYQNQSTQFNGMPYQQMTPQSQYSSYQHQGRNNNAYINNNFPGYATPPPSVDAFRGLQNPGSPLSFPGQMSPLINGGQFGHQGFGQSAGPVNMYGYGANHHQATGYYPSPQMQGVHAGQRGRGVCLTSQSIDRTILTIIQR